ncbi:hypothetical protein NDA11_001394 [Ustilago hordei]|uniref:Uncharacterized protein n=1 Tax=Ustilago hordei TaxID=120017 RepID=I2G712_USTHO|nr:hypothetical protein NDA10_000431 [Ustilago hordei]KAJ1585717.1 hypothetical protein NDA12_001095 [Ustilago hordei]KAJ1588926.1 hypothetical protein NDA15_000559 [Ustilago hordei]KAJ1590632.1 hypothetical protein NDA11_001394 [Ustilago hordei]UTT92940.1 hypothetical protein NDA17_004533 [Ustilago hordei]
MLEAAKTSSLSQRSLLLAEPPLRDEELKFKVEAIVGKCTGNHEPEYKVLCVSGRAPETRNLLVELVPAQVSKMCRVSSFPPTFGELRRVSNGFQLTIVNTPFRGSAARRQWRCCNRQGEQESSQNMLKADSQELTILEAASYTRWSKLELRPRCCAHSTSRLSDLDEIRLLLHCSGTADRRGAKQLARVLWSSKAWVAPATYALASSSFSTSPTHEPAYAHTHTHTHTHTHHFCMN